MFFFRMRKEAKYQSENLPFDAFFYTAKPVCSRITLNYKLVIAMPRFHMA